MITGNKSARGAGIASDSDIQFGSPGALDLHVEKIWQPSAPARTDKVTVQLRQEMLQNGVKTQYLIDEAQVAPDANGNWKATSSGARSWPIRSIITP